MRIRYRFSIPGWTAIVLAALTLAFAPVAGAGAAVGQITYTAKNAASGRTDLFLTDSAGKYTENLTESYQIGNINGFSWSPDGAFLALSDDRNIVYRLDMNTYDLEILAEEGYDPAWSPVGDSIVYTSISDGNQDIYRVGDVNLTRSPSNEYHPVWTRDGKIIFFSNWEDPNTSYLYFMESNGQNVHNYEPADGLPAPNQVCMNGLEYYDEIFTLSWSPDLRKMVFMRDTTEWGQPPRGEIVIQNVETEDETRVFEADGINDHPLWSPDGTNIVFRSDRDSYTENYTKVTVMNLYVMNLDGSGQTRITNNRAGEWIGKAAWRPVTGETSVSETAGELPVPLTIGPVFPNPFNPSTTITFALPASGAAHLSIYSVSGQKVRELVNGNLSAGEHRVVWDGRDGNGRAVSSGVYLSRLEAGGRAATAKVTLVR